MSIFSMNKNDATDNDYLYYKNGTKLGNPFNEF